jgi:hypothetical protein
MQCVLTFASTVSIIRINCINYCIQVVILKHTTIYLTDLEMKQYTSMFNETCVFFLKINLYLQIRFHLVSSEYGIYFKQVCH